jgi:peptidoglycan/LPS O-acetylase OafA/YrhL
LSWRFFEKPLNDFARAISRTGARPAAAAT